MQFDFEAMLAPERYKLLLATVLPRPIAWVTTRDVRGAVNAAPFSFFNVFGNDPVTVGVCADIGPHKIDLTVISGPDKFTGSGNLPRA